MARLVAVGVLADQPGDIARSLGPIHLRRGGEQRVETGFQFLLATDGGDVVVHVVRHEEAPLEGVALGVVALHVRRVAGVEGRPELAVAHDRAHELGLGIEITLVEFRLGRIFVGQSLVAGRQGDLRDAPVIVGHLHAPRDRFRYGVGGDEAIFILIIEVASNQVELARALELLRQVGTVDRRAGSRLGPSLHVALGEPFRDQVRHQRDGGIADHAAGIVGSQRPFRQDGALLIGMHEHLAPVGGQVGPDDRHQRVQSPEGVPERKGRVVGVARLGLAHGAVHAQVTAIRVLISEGGDHRMIQRRVEVLQDGRVLALHLDQVERLFPDAGRCLTGRLEIPSRQFRLHVLGGAIRINGREGDFYVKRLGTLLKLIMQFQVLVRIETEEERVSPFHAVDVLVNRLDRLGEDDPVGDLVEMRPALRLESTLDSRVVDEEILVACHFVTPVGLEDVAQVEHDEALFRIVVSIFMETNTIGRGELHVHPEIVEAYGIVARLGVFGLFFERGDWLDGIRSREGQQSDITQVANASTREMGMTEGIDLVVIIMITAAGVPTHDMRVGAELHHRVGPCGAGEGVPMETGADHRVDILIQIFLLRGGRGG